jgi:hypothetical protein
MPTATTIPACACCGPAIAQWGLECAPYRHAIEQRLICANLPGLTGDADADLMRLVFHHEALVLDPAISEKAAKLVEAWKGRAEQAERLFKRFGGRLMSCANCDCDMAGQTDFVEAGNAIFCSTNCAKDALL